MASLLRQTEQELNKRISNIIRGNGSSTSSASARSVSAHSRGRKGAASPRKNGASPATPSANGSIEGSLTSGPVGANARCEFTVTTQDEYSGAITAVVRGPCRTEVIEDFAVSRICRKSGMSFSAPAVTGNYQLEVRVGRVQLSCSPISFVVNQQDNPRRPIVPSNCWVEGSGICPKVVSGIPCSFTVVARDPAQSRVYAGGMALSVKLSADPDVNAACKDPDGNALTNGSVADLFVKDAKDGTYVVQYTPTKATQGAAYLHVTSAVSDAISSNGAFILPEAVRPEHVGSSPYRVQVLEQSSKIRFVMRLSDPRYTSSPGVLFSQAPGAAGKTGASPFEPVNLNHAKAQAQYGKILWKGADAHNPKSTGDSGAARSTPRSRKAAAEKAAGGVAGSTPTKTATAGKSSPSSSSSTAHRVTHHVRAGQVESLTFQSFDAYNNALSVASTEMRPVFKLIERGLGVSEDEVEPGVPVEGSVDLVPEETDRQVLQLTFIARRVGMYDVSFTHTNDETGGVDVVRASPRCVLCVSAGAVAPSRSNLYGMADRFPDYKTEPPALVVHQPFMFTIQPTDVYSNPVAMFGKRGNPPFVLSVRSADGTADDPEDHADKRVTKSWGRQLVYSPGGGSGSPRSPKGSGSPTGLVAASPSGRTSPRSTERQHQGSVIMSPGTASPVASSPLIKLASAPLGRRASASVIETKAAAASTGGSGRGVGGASPRGTASPRSARGKARTVAGSGGGSSNGEDRRREAEEEGGEGEGGLGGAGEAKYSLTLPQRAKSPLPKPYSRNADEPLESLKVKMPDNIDKRGDKAVGLEASMSVSLDGMFTIRCQPKEIGEYILTCSLSEQFACVPPVLPWATERPAHLEALFSQSIPGSGPLHIRFKVEPNLTDPSQCTVEGNMGARKVGRLRRRKSTAEARSASAPRTRVQAVACEGAVVGSVRTGLWDPNSSESSKQGNPVCGEVQTLSITAYDRWGNRRRKGGDNWEVVATPSSVKGRRDPATDGKCVQTLLDNEDGTYVISLTLETQGTYDLAVLLKQDTPYDRMHLEGLDASPVLPSSPVSRGLSSVNPGNRRIPGNNVSQTLHVRGSPINSVKWTCALCAPPRCTAEGTGLEGGFVNEPCTFTIFPRDRFGNPFSQDMPSKFIVRATGGPDKGEVLDMTTMENGSVQVTYSLRITGTYLLCVQLQGQQINCSPFNITVLSRSESENMLLRV